VAVLRELKSKERRNKIPTRSPSVKPRAQEGKRMTFLNGFALGEDGWVKSHGKALIRNLS
jgi:hypothetical protein